VAQLRPGDLLEERYRILQVVRAEGEVAVYLVEDTTGELGQVAVTEVVDTLPSHAWRLAVEATFQGAAPALRTVQNAALVRVFDAFNVGRRHYLVTEYVPGEVLQAVLDSTPGSTPFRPDQVLDWAIQLCAALQHLHSQSPPVILRDVSPSSILLTEQGTLKLADLGFTRMFLTSNVQTLAAPGYAPPEHYAAAPQPPDAQSDIYALGATLHYLLTGRDPGATPFLFPDAAELNPAVPPALAAIVSRAVALERGARYASAEAMSKDLLAAKHQPQVRPVPTPAVVAPPPPVAAPVPPPVQPVIKPVGQPVPERPARQSGRAALLAVLAVLLLGLVAALAFIGGGLPFLGGVTGDATPTLAAPTATATVGAIVPIDSPVPLVTETPTTAPELPDATLEPPTGTAEAEPPTSTPVPATDTPVAATATPVAATATPEPPTATPAPVSTNPFGVVLETAVNVRAGPSFNARVLGQANRGDVLELFESRIAEDRTWYRVVWNDQEGWMVNTFLRVYQTRAAADAGALPLRATPTP
jgi:hypothetical protein